ncbi:MAG: UDP-N-acetylglucosamine 2-epimerase [Phycisphaeraceae bacterium]
MNRKPQTANRKTIVVVTGTRAEFGLLEPVMKAIARSKGLRLRVVVAGWHWVTGTWRDVRDAGWEMEGKVRMQKVLTRERPPEGRWDDVDALGRGIIGFGRVFDELKPEVVMVLGDRIEAFAAAAAGSVGGIHVAHIHGGDRAEGVADEAMRHAISKLAHLHFVATMLSRERLVRMGEAAEVVWNVGSPAVDGLEGVEASPVERVIVMQHPIGESDEVERRWMGETLEAVRHLEPVVMGPNGDAGCAGIWRAIKEAPPEMEVIEHLPRARWLSMLAGATALVGNSSAGLIEGAVLRVPCVNVGPRQNGREKPVNVVDCDYGAANVREALVKALSLDLRRMRHPYGDGHAGERIAAILAEMDWGKVSVRKRNTY